MQKGTKMEIKWNIPSESRILDRLEELYEVLNYCPDSPFAPAWQHEIEQLEAALSYAG
ncbi:MAG: hypothetical protein ACLR8L_09565 [Oscillospiraceae bacterium]